MSSISCRRIPKRSIIGSSVSVRGPDGIWRQGIVTDMRSNEKRLIPFEKRFRVRVEDGVIKEKHYKEDEIIGPGFQSSVPADAVLLPGQEVFITHSGREVKGQVISHNNFEDNVNVHIEGVGNIMKRLEEVRLAESRKSARLINTDTDFSRLADFNIVEQRRKIVATTGSSRRRLHSMSSFPERRAELERSAGGGPTRIRRGSEKTSTKSIDIHQAGGSRKRRTSESRSDLESGYSSSSYSSNYGSFIRSGDDLRECTAALVLMNLSVSPPERWRRPPPSSLHSSPNTVSDSSTPHTPKPSPTNSLVNLLVGEDRSYVPRDDCDTDDCDEEPLKRQKPSIVTFQCTWRGCNFTHSSQHGIELHVRMHLGRPADPGPESERDYEEEFYYTEIDESEMVETYSTPSNLDSIDVMEADVVIDNSEPPYDRQHSDSITILTGPEGLEPTVTATATLASSAPPHVASWSTVAARNPVIATPVPAMAPQDARKAISEHLDMAKPPFTVQLATNSGGTAGTTTVFYLAAGAGRLEAPVTTGTAVISQYSPTSSPAGNATALIAQTKSQQNRRLISIVPRPDGGGAGVIGATSPASGLSPIGASSSTPTTVMLQSPSAPLSPPSTSPTAKQQFVLAGSQPTVGPRTLIRSEKKCRKVYGIEQKELWCTQCKWKKACARFT